MVETGRNWYRLVKTGQEMDGLITINSFGRRIGTRLDYFAWYNGLRDWQRMVDYGKENVIKGQRNVKMAAIGKTVRDWLERQKLEERLGQTVGWRAADWTLSGNNGCHLLAGWTTITIQTRSRRIVFLCYTQIVFVPSVHYQCFYLISAIPINQGLS